MTQHNKQFVMLSKQGLQLVALGAEQKQRLVDNVGQPNMLHSLDSFGFLKVDQLNFLNFNW